LVASLGITNFRKKGTSRKWKASKKENTINPRPLKKKEGTVGGGGGGGTATLSRNQKEKGPRCMTRGVNSEEGRKAFGVLVRHLALLGEESVITGERGGKRVEKSDVVKDSPLRKKPFAGWEKARAGRESLL